MSKTNFNSREKAVLYRISFGLLVVLSEEVIGGTFLIGLFSGVLFEVFKKSFWSKKLPDRLRALYLLPMIITAMSTLMVTIWLSFRIS
jgi:hypothetical protein